MFSRQQEFQKADVSDAAGLIKAQQHQVLNKTRFFNASSDVFPIVADALNRILVPRHAVMLQEGE